MKRLGLVVLALAATTAPARELPARPSAPLSGGPVQHGIPGGYRFDNPQLLTQQLLWGIVHGVRLLGLRCQAMGNTVAAEAYIQWLSQQQTRVQAAERDLAGHYFGRPTASPEALALALGLKPTLDLDDALLQPACATLAEALQQERYDLNKFYADHRARIEKGDPEFPGAVWVEPEAPSVSAEPAAIPPAPDESAEKAMP